MPNVLLDDLAVRDAVMGITKQLESNHRGMISLIGSYNWALQSVRQLWSSANLEETLALSECPTDLGVSVSPSRAYQRLGQEFDGLFVDLSGSFHPDAFAILVGCVRGGGLICVYWGESDTLLPLETHLMVEGWPNESIGNRLRQRLLTAAMLPPNAVVRERDGIDFAKQFEHIAFVERHYEWTSDQKAAHAMILKVATGRRRRPLVMEAPRGRGKSTILGQAVVDLLGHRSAHIQVVMPHAHSAKPLVKMIESFLSKSLTIGQKLSFAEDRSVTVLTMEQAWDNEDPADVLFVDEAATFPVHLLSKLLSKTCRAVFSTTTAGYEGTGQGFRLRFDPILCERYPERRLVSLQTPVRWDIGDPVEDCIQKVFCLEAKSERCLENNHPVVVQKEIRDELVRRAEWLETIFSLLMRAHHRTAPSDLQRLLDAPNLQLWTATVGGYLAGVCLVSQEGELNAELSEAVSAGTRRPRGHLLPETLMSHAGMKSVGALRAWRIVRIAVDEQFRRRGVGTVLLARVQRAAAQSQVDYLGSSFGATESLLHFWRAVGYQVVRIGIRRGRSSGLHSAVVLRALSKSGWRTASELRSRYLNYFPRCLNDGLRQLEWSVARGLFCERDRKELPDNDESDLEDVRDFMSEKRSYEMISPSLERVLEICLSGVREELRDDADWSFVIRKVFQHSTWRQMEYEGRVGGSRGLGQTQLRSSIRQLLGAFNADVS